MEDKKDILKTVTRLAQTGDWARVVKEYEKLLALDANDINLHNAMGDALSKLGENRKAYEHYIKVLEDAQQKGNTVRLTSLYKKISKLDPKKFDLEGKALHEKLAKIVAAMTAYDAGDLETALPALKDAEKIDKNNPDILTRLGDIYERKDMVGEAAETYAKAIRVLVERGKKDEAITIANKVLKFDKENIEAMAMVADDLAGKGEKKKAEEIFKDLLITLAEKNKTVEGKNIAKHAMDLSIEYGKQFYAYFLFKENKIEEAKKILEGSNDLTMEEKVLLGKIYFKACEYDRAKSVIMSLEPEILNQNVEILELIADSLLKLREYRPAGEYYFKALKILKESAQLDDAIIMANKVMNVDTENVELHEMMAEIYTKKNMKAKVIDEYTKLAALYDKNSRSEDSMKIKQVLAKLKMI